MSCAKPPTSRPEGASAPGRSSRRLPAIPPISARSRRTPPGSASAPTWRAGPGPTTSPTSCRRSSTSSAPEATPAAAKLGHATPGPFPGPCGPGATVFDFLLPAGQTPVNPFWGMGYGCVLRKGRRADAVAAFAEPELADFLGWPSPPPPRADARGDGAGACLLRPADGLLPAEERRQAPCQRRPRPQAAGARHRRVAVAGQDRLGVREISRHQVRLHQGDRGRRPYRPALPRELARRRPGRRAPRRLSFHVLVPAGA